MEGAGKTVWCEQSLNAANGNFRGLCVMLFNCWDLQASERRIPELIHVWVCGLFRAQTVFLAKPQEELSPSGALPKAWAAPLLTSNNTC